jgi:uncharacterized membrane protein
MSKKKESLLQRITQTITTLFLTGIIVLLPITLTIALITFSFRMLVRWLEPLRHITDSTPFLKVIPHPEIIMAVFIILVAGVIYNVFLIRTVIHGLEHLLSQIPIIRQVYSGFKQLVQAFSLQDKMTFKQVVMVEFPRREVYSFGFLTSEFDPTHLDIGTTFDERKFYNVFIPTTPNPTTGFFVIVPTEQVIKIDISRQEAMAMIISGGIIQPQNKKNRPPTA